MVQFWKIPSKKKVMNHCLSELAHHNCGKKKKKSINENINFTFSEKAIEGQLLNNMPYMIKTMAWVTKDSMGQWLGNYALCEILSTIKITLDLKNVTNSNFAY